MDLSIIITSFRARPSMVSACVKSIVKSLYKVSFKYEIIHVNNEASPEMEEFAKKKLKFVRYFPQKDNIGFGKACNIGFKKAKGKHLLFLNDDIIVINQAIQKLLNYLKLNEEVGIIGPALLNFNGTIQDSIWRSPTLTYLLSSRLPFMKNIHAKYTLKNLDHAKIRSIGWLLGAAFMVRAKDLKNIGFMDEKIFLYLEDCDLCRRFWDNGLKVVYYPLAKMFHFHGRASAQGGILKSIFWFFAFYKKAHFKSMIYYLKKYKGQKRPEEKYNIKYE